MTREPPVRLSRIEQQARTRSTLIEAAAEAFAEHGVGGASVEDICARAGFTRGAFYSNFENREDLFLAVLDNLEEQEVAGVVPLFEDHPDPPTLVDRLRARDTEGAPLTSTLLLAELRAHAMRSPVARARLADFDRRQRAAYRVAIEQLLHGAAPPADLDLLALIAQSVVDGINVRHQYDPTVARHADLDALALLLDALQALTDSAP
ncbi:MAG: TetR/AcrR family transcriptional regulator [Actinobacteria bacterium]|nr:TetR/AcrR family transcriptional regulator [Actinomycetota bacterium]